MHLQKHNRTDKTPNDDLVLGSSLLVRAINTLVERVNKLESKLDGVDNSIEGRIEEYWYEHFSLQNE